MSIPSEAHGTSIWLMEPFIFQIMIVTLFPIFYDGGNLPYYLGVDFYFWVFHVLIDFHPFDAKCVKLEH